MYYIQAVKNISNSETPQRREYSLRSYGKRSNLIGQYCYSAGRQRWWQGQARLQAIMVDVSQCQQQAPMAVTSNPSKKNITAKTSSDFLEEKTPRENVLLNHKRSLSLSDTDAPCDKKMPHWETLLLNVETFDELSLWKLPTIQWENSKQ